MSRLEGELVAAETEFKLKEHAWVEA